MRKISSTSGKADARAQQLALRPLGAVDEQPVAAAADQGRRGGALGGRRGAGRPEEDDVEVHGRRFYGEPGLGGVGGCHSPGRCDGCSEARTQGAPIAEAIGATEDAAAGQPACRNRHSLYSANRSYYGRTSTCPGAIVVPSSSLRCCSSQIALPRVTRVRPRRDRPERVARLHDVASLGAGRTGRVREHCPQDDRRQRDHEDPNEHVFASVPGERLFVK